MPAESEAQRKLFCIALSKKRGETPMSYGENPEVTSKMARENTEETLVEYCGTKVKGG